MIRKSFYINLEEIGENLPGNGSVGYNSLLLYAVKMQKAYNIDGYGDAVILGTDYKLYSVTNNVFTTLMSTAFDEEPVITKASYKTRPCLVATTQNKKYIIGTEIKEFSMPFCTTMCFFDNRLFCAVDRNCYYSEAFNIDVFSTNEFILPPTFGNVVNMCRVNDCVIIGCESGAWKLTVKKGEYCVESFTADIISKTLISCMDGGIFLSSGGVCYTDGKSIKKYDFPIEFTLKGEFGYYDHKCYASCILTDGNHGVYIYDFATGRNALININVSSIGGKVGITNTGIVTFNTTTALTVEYDLNDFDFGSGCMKKICGVIYNGDGNYILNITSDYGGCKINGSSGKMMYGHVDGRNFDIKLRGQPKAKSLEIFYYETGGGL